MQSVFVMVYIVGISFTFIIYFAQVILHSNSKLLSTPHHKYLRIDSVDRKGYIRELTEKFKEFDISVDEVDVSRNHGDDTFDYTITIDAPKQIEEEEILSLIEYSASLETLK